jgi:hypothetical protein
MTVFQAGPPVAPVFPLVSEHGIKDLESELVAALYTQRSLEEQLLFYETQASAPADLRKQFFESKRLVQDIELKIRRVRHSF